MIVGWVCGRQNAVAGWANFWASHAGNGVVMRGIGKGASPYIKDENPTKPQSTVIYRRLDRMRGLALDWPCYGRVSMQSLFCVTIPTR